MASSCGRSGQLFAVVILLTILTFANTVGAAPLNSASSAIPTLTTSPPIFSLTTHLPSSIPVVVPATDLPLSLATSSSTSTSTSTPIPEPTVNAIHLETINAPSLSVVYITNTVTMLLEQPTTLLELSTRVQTTVSTERVTIISKHTTTETATLTTTMVEGKRIGPWIVPTDGYSSTLVLKMVPPAPTPTKEKSVQGTGIPILDTEGGIVGFMPG